MKKFNQVISIEVSVDSIAEMLLENLHPDFLHRELVAEAIVGRMLNDNSLGYLYNSLNGFPITVDFEIGDSVATSGTGINHYAYWTPESIERRSTVNGYITEATVVEINPYKDRKLKVQFLAPDRESHMKPQTEWVKHTDWNRRPDFQTVANANDEDIFGYPHL
jgi:hypothetical protein